MIILVQLGAIHTLTSIAFPGFSVVTNKDVSDVPTLLDMCCLRSLILFFSLSTPNFVLRDSGNRRACGGVG